MLLPAVGAVSAVGVSIEKPIAATAEISGLQTAATPLAVLSSTVNASVEGKLNMLLVAARERMFDSLLSAIDTASQVLNVSREPGESSAAYAQRVAAAIRSLTPQQLTVAQQRMDAQMTTPVPLPLLAEALADPASPQATELAFNLEPASSVEPDAVLKAVVNSYGQNAGETDMSAPQTPASAPLQKVTGPAAPAIALAVAAEEPTPLASTSTSTSTSTQPAALPAPLQTQQPAVSAQSAPVAAQPVPSQSTAQSGSTAAPQAAPAGSGTVAAGAAPSLQLGSLVDDLAAASLLAAIATETALPTEVALIRSPLTPPPVPRDIQQIEADIKQGLQVVISPPAMPAGSDLQQIISNPSSSVEKIIAQALTADAVAQSPSPQAANGDARGPASAIAMPASFTDQPQDPVAAAVLPGKPAAQPSVAAPVAMYEAAGQENAPAPFPLGVPFVVANYLPADTPVKTDEARLLDRVEPVDEEESRQAQDEETAQGEDEEQEQADESPVQADAEASGEAEAGSAAARGDGVKPELVALPQPLRDPLNDHAFDFYRRMVAWE